jgi:hypothetical protein
VEFVIILAVVALVVFVVTAPLRRPSARERPVALAELEAAKEAKYREIRDAELDHRTGKLSDADYEAVEGGLRAEALVILRELDRVGGTSEL